MPVVYTSASLALATLEILVHVGRDDLPGDLIAIKIFVPDDLPRRTLTAARLPPDWNRYRAPKALADLGDAWAASGRTALLVVPTAIVPESENILINPAHRDAARIRVLRRTAFSWDRRLRR